jgi:hypothetical protein
MTKATEATVIKALNSLPWLVLNEILTYPGFAMSFAPPRFLFSSPQSPKVLSLLPSPREFTCLIDCAHKQQQIEEVIHEPHALLRPLSSMGPPCVVDVRLQPSHARSSTTYSLNLDTSFRIGCSSDRTGCQTPLPEPQWVLEGLSRGRKRVSEGRFVIPSQIFWLATDCYNTILDKTIFYNILEKPHIRDTEIEKSSICKPNM